MNKKRNWGFVLYLESAPNNWKEILIKSGVEIAISPYHDKDKNPLGDIKKAHYHIIICYPGPTTFNNVKTLVCDILNQPIPQPLESVKGYYRYFTHQDNPEKYQYNKDEIQLYNGFDLNGILNSTEVFRSMQLINNLIRAYDIIEYSDLIDFLQNQEYFEELNVALNHTLYFNTYITSRRHKLKK